MLNFRKLLLDFSHHTLKRGRDLQARGCVDHAQVSSIVNTSLQLSYRVAGVPPGQPHAGHIEIDLHDSEIRDGHCDCEKKYDCEHIAAACIYLEKHYDETLARYAQHAKQQAAPVPPALTSSTTTHKTNMVQEAISSTLKAACEKNKRKQEQALLEETQREYKHAYSLLSTSPFFTRALHTQFEEVELLLLLAPMTSLQEESPSNPVRTWIKVQGALRLAHRRRSFPLKGLSTLVKQVITGSLNRIEGLHGSLTYTSFSPSSQNLLRELGLLLEEQVDSEGLTHSCLSPAALGRLLWALHEQTHPPLNHTPTFSHPTLSWQHWEHPLQFSRETAAFLFQARALPLEPPKYVLELKLALPHQDSLPLSEALLLPALYPGVLISGVYHRFGEGVEGPHLDHASNLDGLILPQPLMTTLSDIGLGQCRALTLSGDLLSKPLQRHEELATVNRPRLDLSLNMKNNRLEVSAQFNYGVNIFQGVPAHASSVEIGQGNGVVRNIWYEQQLLQELLERFTFDESQNLFFTRNEEVILDFMATLIPAWGNNISVTTSPSLDAEFTYDNSQVIIHARRGSHLQSFELIVDVQGPIEGITSKQLWECVTQELPYIDRSRMNTRTKEISRHILLVPLSRIRELAMAMEELGISKLSSQTLSKPLWHLAHLDEMREGLTIHLDPVLTEIKTQLMSPHPIPATPLEENLQSQLRSYQIEGVAWLERLRRMHLGGILADDMGLGKTVQTIAALSQVTQEYRDRCSLIVCPTSVVYNWFEELRRFCPHLKTVVIDGQPGQRKKAIEQLNKVQVAITSYALLQRDVEHYPDSFAYLILDEAQSIKNRQTRSARSVRLVRAVHTLALTGTPVENSIDDLWSLLDALMPGFLGSYERFKIRYTHAGESDLKQLRRKVAPFLLRRMKAEVLKDLPPMSEIIYHCEFTPKQREIYCKIAEQAREELSARVAQVGFENTKVHILSTLMRLKQICCHPALIDPAYAHAESGKHLLLWELLENLLANGHKIVLFSQYTKMLKLLSSELEKRDMIHCYLDGSSKKRMETVHLFNQSSDHRIFLVSLKAGGTGLNLKGADTVIHYDLWWNPAVENQATDRVHRMGQLLPVSCYKLITRGSIEEKIVSLQNRKRDLVRQLIADDEGALAQLTWEEVLQLLQT